MEVSGLLTTTRFSTLSKCEEGKQDKVNKPDNRATRVVGLSHETLRGLQEDKYEFLTKIQLAMIPPALKGKNLVVQALTGSGKTLGFIIPILERCQTYQQDTHGLVALVITPTRELAQQIFDLLAVVGKYHTASAGCCIGGKFIKYEQGIVHKLNIVIGTPGRVQQHMDESYGFDVGAAKIIVIDEVDRLLDTGFGPSIHSILHSHGNPKHRQLIVCSATANIKDNLNILGMKERQFKFIECGEGIKREGFTEYISIVPIDHKVNMLFSLLSMLRRKKVLIFVETCKFVRVLADIARKYFTKNIVFDLQGRGSMKNRVNALQEFSLHEDRAFMFATDLAERGLDIPHLTHVIQFDRPDSMDTYIHRVGRTARLNNTGSAILMICPHEHEFLEELRETSPNIQLMKLPPQDIRVLSRFLITMYRNHPYMVEASKRAVAAQLKSVRAQNMNRGLALKLGATLGVDQFYIPPSIKE